MRFMLTFPTYLGWVLHSGSKFPVISFISECQIRECLRIELCRVNSHQNVNSLAKSDSPDINSAILIKVISSDHSYYLGSTVDVKLDIMGSGGHYITDCIYKSSADIS